MNRLYNNAFYAYPSSGCVSDKTPPFYSRLTKKKKVETIVDEIRGAPIPRNLRRIPFDILCYCGVVHLSHQQ